MTAPVNPELSSCDELHERARLLALGWTCERVSLWDEDGVEGWRWDHPGSPHAAVATIYVVGAWDEPPEIPEELFLGSFALAWREHQRRLSASDALTAALAEQRRCVEQHRLLPAPEAPSPAPDVLAQATAIPPAERRCGFHDAHDAHGRPTGNECQAPATHFIQWTWAGGRARRWSYACESHTGPPQLDAPLAHGWDYAAFPLPPEQPRSHMTSLKDQCCRCGRWVSPDQSVQVTEHGDYGAVHSVEFLCPRCAGERSGG